MPTTRQNPENRRFLLRPAMATKAPRRPATGTEIIGMPRTERISGNASSRIRNVRSRPKAMNSPGNPPSMARCAFATKIAPAAVSPPISTAPNRNVAKRKLGGVFVYTTYQFSEPAKIHKIPDEGSPLTSLTAALHDHDRAFDKVAMPLIFPAPRAKPIRRRSLERPTRQL